MRTATTSINERANPPADRAPYDATRDNAEEHTFHSTQRIATGYKVNDIWPFVGVRDLHFLFVGNQVFLSNGSQWQIHLQMPLN